MRIEKIISPASCAQPQLKVGKKKEKNRENIRKENEKNKIQGKRKGKREREKCKVTGKEKPSFSCWQYLLQ